MRALPQTLALLLLSLTLAGPASSQSTAPDDAMQVIAQQQKVISQIYKLERAGDWAMHLETLALLANYGGWTLYDPGKRIEILHITEYVSQITPELVYAKKEVQRNKSVSGDELKMFSDMYVDVETLFAVAIGVHDLLQVGKIDEANALYRDKSIPLKSAIIADAYSLVSSLEKKIDTAALHPRLAT
jgi:hypothetical protein